MSTGQRWKQFKNIFTPNGGCGCGQKATDIIEPKPKPKSSPFSYQKTSHWPTSSASSWERRGGRKSEDCTSTTFSQNIDTSPQDCQDFHDQYRCSKTVSSCPKIHDSLAIFKDSEDPYHDFRQSMLQMIFEKEIYSRSDLQQLLDCFLHLNSPRHHKTILQVFMEIWNRGSGGDSEIFAGDHGMEGLRKLPVWARGLELEWGGHVKTLNS